MTIVRLTTFGLVVYLLLTSFAINAKDQDLYGPLRSYIQSPIQSASFSPVLRSGARLPEGYIELYSSLAVASVWAETPDYQLDYYHNHWQLGGKWVLAPRWYLDLSYRWSFAADNHLDGVTKTFHKWFGFSQNGRENVNRHRFSGSFNDYPFDYDDFSGDTIASAVSGYLDYHLYQNDHHALSVGATLYYNHVSSGAFASSNFDQSLQLNYSYFRNRHTLYSMLGAVFHGRDTLPGGLPLKPVTYAASLGYKFSINPKNQLFLEYHYIDGYVDDSSDLSQASHEATLGYRYLFSHSAIEFFATENLVNMDNSTDISITLGYRYQW